MEHLHLFIPTIYEIRIKFLFVLYELEKKCRVSAELLINAILMETSCENRFIAVGNPLIFHMKVMETYEVRPVLYIYVYSWKFVTLMEFLHISYSFKTSYKVHMRLHQFHINFIRRPKFKLKDFANVLSHQIYIQYRLIILKILNNCQYSQQNWRRWTCKDCKAI